MQCLLVTFNHILFHQKWNRTRELRSQSAAPEPCTAVYRICLQSIHPSNEQSSLLAGYTLNGLPLHSGGTMDEINRTLVGVCWQLWEERRSYRRMKSTVPQWTSWLIPYAVLPVRWHRSTWAFTRKTSFPFCSECTTAQLLRTIICQSRSISIDSIKY